MILWRETVMTTYHEKTRAGHQNSNFYGRNLLSSISKIDCMVYDETCGTSSYHQWLFMPEGDQCGYSNRENLSWLNFSDVYPKNFSLKTDYPNVIIFTRKLFSVKLCKCYFQKIRCLQLHKINLNIRVWLGSIVKRWITNVQLKAPETNVQIIHNLTLPNSILSATFSPLLPLNLKKFLNYWT